MRKYIDLAETIVYKDAFIKAHNDKKTIVAINPSKSEWNAFFPHGAAAIILTDGRIVVGDGNALDHLYILELASIPNSMEAFRMQIFRNIAFVELWINEDYPQASPEEVQDSVLKLYGKSLDEIERIAYKAVSGFGPNSVKAIPLNFDQEPLLDGHAEFIASGSNG